MNINLINTNDSPKKKLVVTMRNQSIVVLTTFFLCATLLVSAKPATSAEEQRRAILLQNWPHVPNPLCMPILCTYPCFCGSQLDARGCDTCNCLPCHSE